MTLPRRVLLVHNYYRSSSPSGETAVFEDERRLLESRGHEVVTYTHDSDSVGEPTGRAALMLGVRTVWNASARREVSALLAEERPDIVHVHNTFPLISPSVFRAFRAAGIPVVQTLHNYRLLCANGLLEREGSPCERCVGRSPLQGILGACYRDSRAASAAVAASIAFHRAAGTWSRNVDAFIAPSEFARTTLARGGVPAERMHVVPHFVAPDPGSGEHADGSAVFVGRLSAEKGIDTLLAAWEGTTRPLRIIGDGPLAERVAAFAKRRPHVHYEGALPRESVSPALGNARVLLFPSHFRETFGRTVIEAFATGTPVIASRVGAAAELVDDGRTGLLVPARDPASLAAAAEKLLADPVTAARMGRAARAEFEYRFTADAHYRALLEVYRHATHRRTVPDSSPVSRWEFLKRVSSPAEALQDGAGKLQPQRPQTGRELR